MAKVVNYNGWQISDNGHGLYCSNKGKSLLIKAEYKNGLYFNILNYWDGKRSYKAVRYHYKLLPLAKGIAFEALKNGMLWDYQNQCPALNSYKKDIEPYYRKCKELGLSHYDNQKFLDSLFN